MFQNCNFLIIKSKQLTQDKDISQLLFANNVANIYIKDDFDNSKNYMDPPKITHIISNTIDFIEHELAIKSMIPIVTPSWVYDSISNQKMQNIRTYNPDPAYFFKDCFICCADNLPPGDKELIYAAAQAFGGGFLDNITKYTTHLIAMDISNEKSILASSIIHDDNDSNNGDLPSIKIVLPHWIDHCITMGKRLNEEDYLLPDAKILHDESNDVLKNEILPEVLNDSLPKNEVDPELQFFKNKKFYINSDFNLSQRSSNALKFVIERHGGLIQKKFDVNEIDIYLGKFRQGDTYKKSCASNRIIVGNLQWLYFILVSKSWTLPLHSNILYYPRPATPLNGLEGLKISITNYSGEARSYLSKLITTMGGVFTKTLTKENDYLVCGKAEGRKFDAALNKWVDSEGNLEIKVVNHLWLEDCYVEWRKVDSGLDKYKNFGDDSIGMEPWVGRAHLDAEVLKLWYEDEEKSASDGSANIDDSMNEDESTQSRRGATTTTKQQLDNSQVSELVNVEEKNDVTPSSLQPAKQQVSPMSVTSNKTLKSTTETTPELKLLPAQKEFSPEPLTSPIVATATNNFSSRYGGRSAAKKAAAKLHDNMSDLIAYQEMAKSSRKMKSYMDQLEGSLTPLKKRKHTDKEEGEDDEEEEEEEEVENLDETKELSQSGILKAKKPTHYHIIAIMTGCEQIIELNKSDLQKLQAIGIKIVNDVDKSSLLNTVIAPKILRTEKFLRSLSKVDKIIHPDYLVNVINHISKGENVLKEYRIDDYSLDKINKNTNLELGYPTSVKINGITKLLSHDKKGKLFLGMNFNLSSNLNGGIDVISRILKDHGMNHYKEIKTSINLNKSLIETDYNGGDKKIILIVNKTKDNKLTNSFKKSIRSGIILEWDWCVKSIFKMELQDIKKFQI